MKGTVREKNSIKHHTCCQLTFLNSVVLFATSGPAIKIAGKFFGCPPVKRKLGDNVPAKNVRK